MKNMPLVSIVVPVYNVEQYIEKCLNSVTNQNYKNLEIIVVNDGSPDSSEDKIMPFVDKDIRIKYIKKNNGGLSSARNRGLLEATGEYISFIDSDDWIHENFISSLMNSILENNSDIAVCNMSYVFPDGSIKKRTPLIKNKKCVSNIEALGDLLNGEKFKFHVVNKLYNRKLFSDITSIFPEGKTYEDVYTTYKLFYKAKRISYVSENLYFYLQNRPGSILYNRFNSHRLDIFEAMDNIDKFITINQIGLENEFKHMVILNVISLVNYIYPIWKSIPAEQLNQYKCIILDSVERYRLKGFHKNPCIDFKEKVRFFLIIYQFDFYLKLMNVLKRKG